MEISTYLLTFPVFTNLQAFVKASQMLKVQINIDPNPNTEKQSPTVNYRSDTGFHIIKTFQQNK